MHREKLITTAVVASAVVTAAMLVDYLITIVILNDHVAYTPWVTLAISTIVAFPVSYGLISAHFNVRIARDQLAAARAKAEEDRASALEASRAKSEFLANMSHELRTPLNAILGFSELLASSTFADKRAEYAGLIHSSGAHLLGLVDGLLDLSRIEAGKVELNEELVDMYPLVLRCIELMEPRAREAGVILSCGIDDEAQVVGDRRALTQVILNLLSNALKFTNAGGCVEAFVRLGPDLGLSFGVRDEGLGIPEDEHERIFERFGQGRHDVSHTEKGTGLGLPIVKGLIEAHGGRVEMTSRQGEGTCVTAWLPPGRVKPASQTAAA